MTLRPPLRFRDPARVGRPATGSESDFNNFRSAGFGQFPTNLTGHGHHVREVSRAGIYYELPPSFQERDAVFIRRSSITYRTASRPTWTPDDAGRALVYPSVFSSRPAKSLPGPARRERVGSAVELSRRQQPGRTRGPRWSMRLRAEPSRSRVSGVYTHAAWNKEWELDTNQVYSDCGRRPGCGPERQTTGRFLQYQYSGTAKYYAGRSSSSRDGRAVLGFQREPPPLARGQYDEGNNLLDDPWWISGPASPASTVRRPTRRRAAGRRQRLVQHHVEVRRSLGRLPRRGSGMAVRIPVANGLDLNGDGQAERVARPTVRPANAFPRTWDVATRTLRFTQDGSARRSQGRTSTWKGFNLSPTASNVQTVNNDYGPVPGTPKSTWLVPLNVTCPPAPGAASGVRFHVSREHQSRLSKECAEWWRRRGLGHRPGP